MKEPVSKRLPFFCGFGGGGAAVVVTIDEDGIIDDDVIIGDGEMVELLIDDVIFITDDEVALIEMVVNGAVVFMVVDGAVVFTVVDGAVMFMDVMFMFVSFWEIDGVGETPEGRLVLNVVEVAKPR